jgi:hypothetical protein
MEERRQRVRRRLRLPPGQAGETGEYGLRLLKADVGDIVCRRPRRPVRADPSRTPLLGGPRGPAHARQRGDPYTESPLPGCGC